MSAPVVALTRPAPAAAPASPFDFTDEQRALIRDTFANGCSDGEFAVLMEVARARRLNPLLKQIHFVQRWDSEKHRMVWATQASIDGLRAIAERTGLYQGQDEPEFVENEDGTIKLCRVRVWRRDWPRPSVGVAYWAEYVQTTRDKQTGKTRPTAMWSRMPHVMLAKVAESIALRKAFPEDMGGLYSSDEMAQALVEVPTPEEPPADRPGPQRVEVTAAPPPPATGPAPALEAPAAAAPPPAFEEPAPAEAPAREPARVDDVEPPPAEVPAAAEGFYARIGEIELPGEAVATWIKHRAELAALSAADRESAWKALCKRTEEVGKMKNSKVWLKKAIAEEDARRAALAGRGANDTWSTSAAKEGA